MKVLEVSIKDASGASNLVGAVFRDSAGDDDPPVVAPVVARPSFSTRFGLATGLYLMARKVDDSGRNVRDHRTLRMNAPTRVTRGSSFCAQTALPATSASCRTS